eukprot:SAG31_NODE_9667_length_1244_cov_0.967686_1_plen_182_part_10
MVPDTCGINHFAVTGEPARHSCEKCPRDEYQNSKGAAHCELCLKGFVCNERGMTYPIALPGYWVSPEDPSTLSVCSWGENACPGGTANVTESSMLDKGTPCSTNENQNNRISDECVQIVGARCSPGYAVVEGAGCDQCCRQEDSVYSAGSNCDGQHNYFPQSGLCHKCPDGHSMAGLAAFVI